ncbi:hypothetical protein HK104_001486 [Borealophlyctis nickersoniae]|nr:hypothetical protein HK104_001486 [Borealophlyctis nickersoniae]
MSRCCRWTLGGAQRQTHPSLVGSLSYLKSRHPSCRQSSLVQFLTFGSSAEHRAIPPQATFARSFATARASQVDASTDVVKTKRKKRRKKSDESTESAEDDGAAGTTVPSVNDNSVVGKGTDGAHATPPPSVESGDTTTPTSDVNNGRSLRGEASNEVPAFVDSLGGGDEQYWKKVAKRISLFPSQPDLTAEPRTAGDDTTEPLAGWAEDHQADPTLDSLTTDVEPLLTNASRLLPKIRSVEARRSRAVAAPVGKEKILAAMLQKVDLLTKKVNSLENFRRALVNHMQAGSPSFKMQEGDSNVTPKEPSDVVDRLALLNITPVAVKPYSIYAFEDAEQADSFLKVVNHNLGAVGFDTEKVVESKIPSTVQLAFSENLAAVFLIEKMCQDSSGNINTTRFPEQLRAILGSTILKVGVGALGDMRRLQDAYGVKVSKVLDLNDIAPARGARHMSLEGLYESYVGKPMDYKNVRRGPGHRWDAALENQTTKALKYAADDATAGLAVFNRMFVPPTYGLQPKVDVEIRPQPGGIDDALSPASGENSPDPDADDAFEFYCKTFPKELRFGFRRRTFIKFLCTKFEPVASMAQPRERLEKAESILTQWEREGKLVFETLGRVVLSQKRGDSTETGWTDGEHSKHDDLRGEADAAFDFYWFTLPDGLRKPVSRNWLINFLCRSFLPARPVDSSTGYLERAESILSVWEQDGRLHTLGTMFRILRPKTEVGSFEDSGAMGDAEGKPQADQGERRESDPDADAAFKLYCDKFPTAAPPVPRRWFVKFLSAECEAVASLPTVTTRNAKAEAILTRLEKDGRLSRETMVRVLRPQVEEPMEACIAESVDGRWAGDSGDVVVDAVTNTVPPLNNEPTPALGTDNPMEKKLPKKKQAEPNPQHALEHFYRVYPAGLDNPMEHTWYLRMVCHQYGPVAVIQPKQKQQEVAMDILLDWRERGRLIEKAKGWVLLPPDDVSRQQPGEGGSESGATVVMDLLKCVETQQPTPSQKQDTGRQSVDQLHDSVYTAQRMLVDAENGSIPGTDEDLNDEQWRTSAVFQNAAEIAQGGGNQEENNGSPLLAAALQQLRQQ